MQEGTSVVEGHISVIERQIKEALKELEHFIERKGPVKNAAGLEAIEREIIKATDRLAGLIVAQKIQQSIDSPELKEEASKLVKSLPKKMKNQGAREVKLRWTQICRGRSGKKLKTEKNYFVKNRERMNYDTIASLELPIGSGAMESAIRRVINLRLKGASIYWHPKTAEAMLLLRSFYKAGRFRFISGVL